MSDLRITTLQSSLHWEDIDRNLAMFEEKLEPVGPTDLIVLPEMFTTGFTMNSRELAEPMDGRTVEWMKAQAAKKDTTLCGSAIIKEGKEYFNRMIWMPPNGHFSTYDKRHLFRFAGENEHYNPGHERRIVDLKGWRVQLSICFDLRFPVWLRNRNDHDLLICNANWPEPRSNAWQILLRARAIENQVYVVGVNRVGKDDNDQSYSGDSAVIGPKGETMSSIPPSEEHLATHELSWEELERFRDKFPVLRDADDFDLK